MFADICFDDRPSFLDKYGKSYRFVELRGQKVFCWDVMQDMSGSCKSKLINIPLSNVTVASLHDLGLWDNISEIQQKRLTSNIELNTSIDTHKKREKRSTEYDYLPRKITCIRCSDEKYIAPCVLIKQAGLEGLEGDAEQKQLEKFLSEYRCSTCSPKSRGRKANPLYANIPRTAKCKCGKECTMNVKKLYTDYNGDMTLIQKYCDEYLCRSCNPNTGSWLRGNGGKGGRGRKANPDNEGIPNKVTCIECKREVGITPTNIRLKAKKLGITVESLLSDYHCRKCGGMLKKS